MQSARADFFVSYTSIDEGWAEWIAHVLEEAGYTVVLQAWDFRPGSNFVIEMQRALQSSDRLIAVLSPDYLTARFPEPEWAAVFAADPQGVHRRLVPVVVRRCEPDGLLSQVVQIRVHDLDKAAAQQKLLDGVKTGRAKPAVPPVFPGVAGPLPGTGDGARRRSGERLTWQRVPSPPEVVWRGALEDRLPNTNGYEAVELHLVPVGDDARLPVRDLTELSTTLPSHGRQHGIFSSVEALDARVDATKVTVVSTARGGAAGLGVTRSGQRSAWVGLPRDMLGAILDEADLADQLAKMLDTLTGLALPTSEFVIPVVGIEPARMVSVGRVANLPRTSAQFGHHMPEHLRPPVEDAVTFAAVRSHGKGVAVELAAKLAAEHKTPARRG